MVVNLPSISATSGTLTASGVGSGLDIKGLVSQLMTVEQRPLTLLNQQEADFQSKLTSLGSVQGSMSTLQTAAMALASAGITYATSVSDATVATVTADSTAVAGNHALNVTQLAQAQRLVSPALAQTSLTQVIGAADPAATDLTITLGSAGPPFAPDASKTAVTLNINSSNNTLAGIRDAINAANAGVTASIVNDGSATPFHLVLTSNATGALNNMRLSMNPGAEPAIMSLLGYDSGAPTANFSELQGAQNALLRVDGVDITSASNSVSGAIQGLTLGLLKPTGSAPGSAVNIAVKSDTAALGAALTSLVSAYNSAATTIAGATAKGAVLQGDWAVLGLQRKVRALLGGAQSTGGAYTNLTQLGVSFQKDGSLQLDSVKLNAALAANVGGVAALAAAMGNAVKTATFDILGKSGPISNETGGINQSIKDIGSRRIDIQSRLDATQARYQAQFSALDTLLSSMTSTSTFLTQQLGNLPNYYNTKG